jgi:hypothetical protein
LSRFVVLQEIWWWGGSAIQGDLDAMIFNSIALTILRWLTNLKSLTLLSNGLRLEIKEVN